MSDAFEPRSAHQGRFRPFASFLVSLRFLTQLPVPFVRTVDPPRLKDSMAMFPVVGVLVGAITGGALVLASMAGLPDLFSALFALAITAMVTGAFHEDGLADVADGFGGGSTREERLEIMKDSRIGAHGTLILVITVLARASLLTALLDLTPQAIMALTAGAAAFSRALMVDLLATTRPARSNGLSVLAGQPTRQTGFIAIAIGGLACGLAAYSYLNWKVALLGVAAAGLALGAVRALAMRKIGGQTGDVCGAAQVMAETATLAVFAAAVAAT
jgi:adenosylcobinamide-GDP ribazoletransferase